MSIFIEFVLSLLFLSSVNCECQQLATMYCVDLNDYLNYEIDLWRQLTVGPQYKFTGEYTLFDLSSDLLQDLVELESLTIQNLINETVKEDAVFRLQHDKLRFFNFYKNNIEIVHMENFGNFPSLIELNLINNNIRNIRGSMEQSDEFAINSINFAKNRLKVIRTNSFKNFHIKRLDFSFNRIVDVQIGSFNTDLEILKLDHNNLENLNDDLFKNLKNLKELTISDNNLLAIGDLSPLSNQLRKLDFAYNSIKEIRTNFRQFRNLFHIDLSHNRLERYDLDSLIPANSNNNKKISVAFNLLKDLQINGDNKFNSTTMVILFGNPWICQCLEKMDEFFRKNSISRSPCDMKLFGSGKFPYCVAGNSCENSTVTNRNHTQAYGNALPSSENDYICDVDYDMLNLIKKNL